MAALKEMMTRKPGETVAAFRTRRIAERAEAAADYILDMELALALEDIGITGTVRLAGRIFELKTADCLVVC